MASDGMTRTGGELLGVCVQQLQVVGWLGPRGWDALETSAATPVTPLRQSAVNFFRQSPSRSVMLSMMSKNLSSSPPAHRPGRNAIIDELVLL